MCGLSGFISNHFKKMDLKRMNNCLIHRGPDTEGKTNQIKKRKHW